MEAREVTRYLASLYDPAQALEVAYIKPGGGTSGARRVVRNMPEDPTNHDLYTDILDEMERAEAAGYNIYTAVLPETTQANNLYDRVWADQDDPAAPWPFGADDAWKGAAWPMPTTLVRTSEADGGFRWQAIWRLTAPLDQAAGRELVKRLAKHAGADQAVHDPRRVLRVPGLMNAKRGTMARLLETRPSTVTPEAFSLPTETALEALLNTPVNSPHQVLGEWLAGTSEGDRSRRAYVAARFLKSCGVLIGDAAAILKVGALRSDPIFEDRELEHAVKSAYHRQEA